MKGFLGNFAICLAICFVGMFLLAGLIAKNIWVVPVLIALVMAISITAYVGQETRISALEKRIEQLEGNREEPKPAAQ